MGDWTRVFSLLLTVSLLRTGPAFPQAPRVPSAILSSRATLTGTPSTRSRLFPPSGHARVVALESRRSAAPTQTYWLEGAVIGAVVLGVASHVAYRAVAASLCTGSDAGGCNDYRTRVTVGGAAVGFLVGALIGRRHLKHGRSTTTPPGGGPEERSGRLLLPRHDPPPALLSAAAPERSFNAVNWTGAEVTAAP